MPNHALQRTGAELGSLGVATQLFNIQSHHHMKHYLLLFVFLFGLSVRWATAATALVDVVEVKWGATPVTVREIISKRPGVTFDVETADAVTFKGGNFSGEAIESWRFEFTGGKFTKLNIRFVVPTVIDKKGKANNNLLYDRLHTGLQKKYGKPEQFADSAHHHHDWILRNPSVPGASTNIVLHFRWLDPDARMDLTYSDIPAPKSTIPTTPKPRVKNEF